MLMLAYNKEDYNIDCGKGFFGRFAEHGLSSRDAVIRSISNNAQGFPLLMRRLSGTNPPTAVVCVNDTMAAFMMQRVRKPDLGADAGQLCRLR